MSRMCKHSATFNTTTRMSADASTPAAAPAATTCTTKSAATDTTTFKRLSLNGLLLSAPFWLAGHPSGRLSKSCWLPSGVEAL